MGGCSVSEVSEIEELKARVAALESAAFRTGHDLGEIRRVQDEHTGHLEAMQLGVDAVEGKLDEAARLADTRHTAVTAMLQEVLDRLPPRK